MSQNHNSTAITQSQFNEIMLRSSKLTILQASQVIDFIKELKAADQVSKTPAG